MVLRSSSGRGPARLARPGLPDAPAAGLSRSCGARLACLTRRGRPFGMSSGPVPAACGSSQGGPAVAPVGGEATGVIRVGGPAGPVQPGNDVPWSGYGAEPASR